MKYILNSFQICNDDTLHFCFVTFYVKAVFGFNNLNRKISEIFNPDLNKVGVLVPPNKTTHNKT